ncbi:protein of unknown function (plasmid) [Caballeronia sp. S22]
MPLIASRRGFRQLRLDRFERAFQLSGDIADRRHDPECENTGDQSIFDGGNPAAVANELQDVCVHFYVLGLVLLLSGRICFSAVRRAGACNGPARTTRRMCITTLIFLSPSFLSITPREEVSVSRFITQAYLKINYCLTVYLDASFTNAAFWQPYPEYQ